MAESDLVRELLSELKAQRAEMQAQRVAHEQQLEKLLETKDKQLEEQRSEMKEIMAMLMASKTDNGERKSALDIMHDVSQRVPQFVFDCDVEQCFSLWYDRYQSVFVEDAASLDEKSRVRVLLERLDTAVFQQYKSHILPVQPDEQKYADTVSTLKKLFDRSLSLFTQRFQLLRVEKEPNGDLLSYYGTINELCERTEIGKVTKDEWKALLYIYGLKDAKHNDLRKRLVLVMDKFHRDGKDITLKVIHEEAESFLSTQRDANMIGSGQKELPRSAEVCQAATWTCWNCGRTHEREKCKKPPADCDKCGGDGHLAKFCDRVKKWHGGKDSNKSRSKRANHLGIYNVEVKSRVEQPSQVQTISLQRKVKINDRMIEMTIDTGARVTLMTEAVWKQLGQPRLREAMIEIRGPSQEVIETRGVLDCKFMVDDCEALGEAYVNRDKNLFGLDWIMKIPKLRYHALKLMGVNLVQKENKLVKPIVAHGQTRHNKRKSIVTVGYIEAKSCRQAVELSRPSQNQRIAGNKAGHASSKSVNVPVLVEDRRKETCKGDVLRTNLKSSFKDTTALFDCVDHLPAKEVDSEIIPHCADVQMVVNSYDKWTGTPGEVQQTKYPKGVGTEELQRADSHEQKDQLGIARPQLSKQEYCPKGNGAYMKSTTVSPMLKREVSGESVSHNSDHQLYSELGMTPNEPKAYAPNKLSLSSRRHSNAMSLFDTTTRSNRDQHHLRRPQQTSSPGSFKPVHGSILHESRVIPGKEIKQNGDQTKPTIRVQQPAAATHRTGLHRQSFYPHPLGTPAVIYPKKGGVKVELASRVNHI